MSTVFRCFQEASNQAHMRTHLPPDEVISNVLAFLETLESAGDAEFRVNVVKHVIPSLCRAFIALEKA